MRKNTTVRIQANQIDAYARPKAVYDPQKAAGKKETDRVRKNRCTPRQKPKLILIPAARE
jgi:hypothetical protein